MSCSGVGAGTSTRWPSTLDLMSRISCSVRRASGGGGYLSKSSSVKTGAFVEAWSTGDGAVDRAALHGLLFLMVVIEVGRFGVEQNSSNKFILHPAPAAGVARY